MNGNSYDLTSLWPLAVFAGCVVMVVTAMIAMSYVLGERHRDRVTDEPYESGMPVTETVGAHFNIKYYLVAIFFVIFDVEALFIFAWAVSARKLGWSGYIEAVVFIAFLLVALVYLWRLGALDWGARKKGAARPLPETGKL